MKRIKIIILLSLFLGFSSVFAQTSKTDTNKSDQENKTEQVDPKTKTASQQQVLNARVETPATAKAPKTTTQKQKEVFVKTRPYPSELDEEQLQQAKSKSTPVVATGKKSEPQFTPANPDPSKKTINVKNNDYD